MDAFVSQSGAGSVPAAYLAIAAIIASAICLASLHVTSPEFDPSWRMVSEYANGRTPVLLTAMFFTWAVASAALAVAVLPIAGGWLGKAGLGCLVLAAIGQTMGGLFDINHPLHGPAAMIGVPSLCVAAVLATMAMARQAGMEAPPWWSAHLPWVSFALMIAAMMLFFSALKAVGFDMSAQTGPLQTLPEGVSAWLGWANRLLFATTYLWVVLAALAVVRSGST